MNVGSNTHVQIDTHLAELETVDGDNPHGIPLAKRNATIAPAVTDDSASGYGVGSEWNDVTADRAYVCMDASVGAAVWVETTAGAGGGEANTTSNGGTGGIGIVLAKSGVDLPFKSMIAASSKLTVVDGGANNRVELDVVEANLTLDNLGGALSVSKGGTGSTTASDARTALNVDIAGTDNSTEVTLAGTPDYITIVGQVITRALINLASHVTGLLPIANGGTGASTAGGARTALGLAIGSEVQGYDANTAKLNVDQTWSGSQRSALVVDNDGSFDMDAGNNFDWTPAAADTLEFTSEAAGQSGVVLLNNPSAYTISLGAEIEAETGTAAALSAAGTYLIFYICHDGTNVGITYSAAIS